MWIPTKYILFLTIGLACFRNPLFAQPSVQNKFYSPLQIDGASFEIAFHPSILALKTAESTLEDSITASRLGKIGYLAIAQSGFSSSQIDINQRTGYWMLPYPVAIKYGLIVNTIIDERKYLPKSTNAAYLYWQALKARYKFDSLADLAFITSSIAITKFSTDSINHPRGYNKLISTRIQLAYIKKNYLQNLLKKDIAPIEPIGLVQSLNPISFEVIHQFIQLPIAETQKLNPQWVSNLYDPRFGKLALPANYVEKFKEQTDKMEQKTSDDALLLLIATTKRIHQLKGDIPDLNRYKPIRYKVKMGDNLGRIAQQHHVKISSIRVWNELKSDRIYAGQKLTIYVPMNQKVTVVKKAPKKVKKTTIKEGEYQAYTVKTGDTLWGISQLFESINADMIMEDNGIDENISPGQVLKIRKIE